MTNLIQNWTHTEIPNFQVRPYQQEHFYESTIFKIRELLTRYKRTGQPPHGFFLNASVGTGKSLGIAMLAKHITDRGGTFLSLARQGELCEQNRDEAWCIECMASAYSASIGQKSTRYPAIYGTEGTLARALESQEFATLKVDVLAIDECHMVDFENPDSQFMRIINHFRRINPALIIVGYTGSPYRGINSILSKDGLWQECICDISTEWAIEQGYLLPPHFGFPPDDDHLEYDGLEVSADTGDYNEREMGRQAEKQKEKLPRIMRQVVDKAAERSVVLIFAASQRHCKQVAEHLPESLTGIITDKTPKAERRAILKASKKYREDDPNSGFVVDDKGRPLREGWRIKYLINCSTLTTGVNIPTIDMIVYLRPVGSLVLLIQSIGRGLRLCDHIGKKDCLVLDFADVMARLGGLYNSAILEAAELERSQAAGTTKKCPECGTINGEFARRCIGEIKTLMGEQRCEYFWQSQECPNCKALNDITARDCRSCGTELKDPNEKLTGKAYTDADLKPVLKREFAPVKNGACLMITYTLDLGNGATEQAREFFWPGGSNEMSRRLWKLWVLDHIRDQAWRGKALSLKTATQVCRMAAMFDQPKMITHRVNDKGKSIIHRRVFRSGRESVGGKSVAVSA